MKKVLAFVLSLILGFSTTYAEEQNILNYTNITETSVDLFWDVQEGYSLYEIGYAKDSVENSEYNLVSDYIEDIETTISGLESGETYYFSLYGYNDLGVKNKLSTEIYFNTLSTFDEAEVFKLESAEMYDENQILVTFSTALDTTEGTFRDFRIFAVDDTFDKYNVLNTEITGENNESLILTLDAQPSIGTEYKIVVIDITNINGQNIEFGVDSEIAFYAEEPIELNSADEIQEVIEETQTGELIDLNAAEDNVFGTDLDESEVTQNVESVAAENTSLPTTGPEHVLLLILAIIFSGLFFVSRFKNS